MENQAPSPSTLRKLAADIVLDECKLDTLTISNATHPTLYLYLYTSPDSSSSVFPSRQRKDETEENQIKVVDCSNAVTSKSTSMSVLRLQTALYCFLLDSIHAEVGGTVATSRQLPAWLWHGFFEKLGDPLPLWFTRLFSFPMPARTSNTVAAVIHPDRYLLFRQLLPQVDNMQYTRGRQLYPSKVGEDSLWWKKLLPQMDELAFSEKETYRALTENEGRPSPRNRNSWTFKVMNFVSTLTSVELKDLHERHELQLPVIRSTLAPVQGNDRVSVSLTSLSAAVYATCWKIVSSWTTFFSVHWNALGLYDCVVWLLHHAKGDPTYRPQNIEAANFGVPFFPCAETIARNFLSILFGQEVCRKQWLGRSRTPVPPAAGQECTNLEKTILQLRDFDRILSRYHRRPSSLSASSTVFVKYSLLQPPPFSEPEVTEIQYLRQKIRELDLPLPAVLDRLQAVDTAIQLTHGHMEASSPAVLCFYPTEEAPVTELQLHCALKYYSEQYGVPSVGCYTTLSLPSPDSCIYVVMSAVDLYHLQFGLLPYLCTDRSLRRKNPAPLYPTLADSLLFGDEVDKAFALRSLHQLLTGGKINGCQRMEQALPVAGSPTLSLVSELLQKICQRFFCNETYLHYRLLLPLCSELYVKQEASRHRKRQKTTDDNYYTETVSSRSSQYSSKSCAILRGDKETIYRSLRSLLELQREDHYIDEAVVHKLLNLFHGSPLLRLRCWRAALVVKRLYQQIDVNRKIDEHERELLLFQHTTSKKKKHWQKGRPRTCYELRGDCRIELPSSMTVWSGAVTRVVSDVYWFRDGTDKETEEESLEVLDSGDYGKWDVPSDALSMVCNEKEEEEWQHDRNKVDRYKAADPILTSHEAAVTQITFRPVEKLYQLLLVEEDDIPTEVAEELFYAISVGSGEVPLIRKPLASADALKHMKKVEETGWFRYYASLPPIRTSLPTLPGYSLAKEPPPSSVTPSEWSSLDAGTLNWAQKNYKQQEKLRKQYRKVVHMIPLAIDVQAFLHAQLCSLQSIQPFPSTYMHQLHAEVQEDNATRSRGLVSTTSTDQFDCYSGLLTLLSQLERAAYYPLHRKKETAADRDTEDWNETEEGRAPSLSYSSSSSSTSSGSFVEKDEEGGGGKKRQRKATSANDNTNRRSTVDRSKMSPPDACTGWPSFSCSELFSRRRIYPFTIDPTAQTPPSYCTELFPLPLSAITVDSCLSSKRKHSDRVSPLHGELLPLAGCAPGLIESVLINPIQQSKLLHIEPGVYLNC